MMADPGDAGRWHDRSRPGSPFTRPVKTKEGTRLCGSGRMDGGMIEAQCLAARMVGKVLAGAALTDVLQELWRARSDLSGQQRGAIQDLSYGVLRFYGLLDGLLALLLNKPIRNGSVRHLLLVGLYQLEYSRAPAHAIVDHAVSSVRALNGNTGAQGLVNAVLRNFERRRAHFLTRAAGTEMGQYSHPQWWMDRLRADYPQRYRTILEIGNQRPPMTLRVNRRRIGVAEYAACLEQEGMQAQHLWDDALMLARPVAVDRLPGFSRGWVSVQDAGAQLAAHLLDARDGMRVLDACAAPGGKSAHLLELANLELTALDSDCDRIARIVQNLARLGLDARRVVHGDAANPAQWWDGRHFDRILADVPCSASGVVRRHPDIKWLRRPGDLPRFGTRQGMILEALWPLLARGGKLLYATCSVFPEENLVQIERFMQGHPDARLLPLSRIGAMDGQLLPDSRHDGFFYALLRKA